MDTVTIVALDLGAAAVYSPYAIKDTIKDLPKRRWDVDRRAWIIPLELADGLEATLLAEGFSVARLTTPRFRKDMNAAIAAEVTRECARLRYNPNVERSWVEQAFASAPDPARLYRALASSFHPDVGGDHLIMVEINDCWQRHRQSA